TWRKVFEPLRPRWPGLADLMDGGGHDVLVCMSFPRPHRIRPHPTNPMEWWNKVVNRRADVVSVLRNGASGMRLIGTVLLKQNDHWQTSRRDMMVEAFAQFDPEAIAPGLGTTTTAA
ncbi:MAG: transposase, partial [Rhodobacteraceae bacterium]|nr:transposase [Paracoccaceae bacterium]